MITWNHPNQHDWCLRANSIYATDPGCVWYFCVSNTTLFLRYLRLRSFRSHCLNLSQRDVMDFPKVHVAYPVDNEFINHQLYKGYPVYSCLDKRQTAHSDWSQRKVYSELADGDIIQPCTSLAHRLLTYLSLSTWDCLLQGWWIPQPTLLTGSGPQSRQWNWRWERHSNANFKIFFACAHAHIQVCLLQGTRGTTDEIGGNSGIIYQLQNICFAPRRAYLKLWLIARGPRSCLWNRQWEWHRNVSRLQLLLIYIKSKLYSVVLNTSMKIPSENHCWLNSWLLVTKRHGTSWTRIWHRFLLKSPKSDALSSMAQKCL